MVKVSPIISVIAGLVITFIFASIVINLAHFSSYLNRLILITPVIGGFTATYFAREKKMVYGLCVGAVLAAISILGLQAIGYMNGLINILVGSISIILLLVLAVFGAYLARLTR